MGMFNDDEIRSSTIKIKPSYVAAAKSIGKPLGMNLSGFIEVAIREKIEKLTSKKSK